MRPSALLALAALAIGVAIGLGAARAWPASLEGRPARGDAIVARDRAPSPPSAPAGRPETQAPRASAGIDAGGLDDRFAAIVLEEVRAALATATADAGAVRLSGHVRTLEGAPVAGVLVEATRLPEPPPPPSDEEALAIAAAQRARRGPDPRTALEARLRDAARALVRRRALAPSAVSGPDGAYEIAGLAPGRHRVRAEAARWRVRPRQAEDAPALERDDVLVVGGGAVPGGSGPDAAAPGATRLDWVAERRVPVRFQAEWPLDAEPKMLMVNVRGAGTLFHEAGEEDVRGGTLLVRPGLHVAEAFVKLRLEAPPGSEVGLFVDVPFVVDPGAEGMTVPILFVNGPSARVIVGGDDLEGEDWERVIVEVRPVGAVPGADAIGRLADGAPGIELAPHHDVAEDDLRRCAHLPPLPPGLYEAEARRDLDPPEAPGPRVPFEVRANGDSEVEVRLPPAGRDVRITVVVEGIPPGDRDIGIALERRSSSGTRTIATATLDADGEARVEAGFALRPADIADPEGAAAAVVAVARCDRAFMAEAPVPSGREARVLVRLPEAATLALEVDPGAHAAAGSALVAILSTAEGDLGADGLAARGGGGSLAAAIGPVGAGVYDLRIEGQADGEQQATLLATTRVALAPGPNRLSLALPPVTGAALRSARAGRLLVFAADAGASLGPRVLAEQDATAGAPTPLPPFPAGRYVALLEAAPDPFAAADAPRERAAMTFDLPSDAPVIDFAPDPLAGWAPRLVAPSYAHLRAGLRTGDLILSVEGAPPGDIWAPLAPLAGEGRARGPARVEVLRDGARMVLEIAAAALEDDGLRLGFAPVPGRP